MGCLCCGSAVEVGALCRACAHEVPPCEGLIAEHIRSNIDADDAETWVVDGFGAPHAIAAKTSIGRNHEGELVVLASSVSREHAELKKTDSGWTVRDLGSRNGTFVDGTRVQGRVTLNGRHVLKIGDVAMWFLTEVRVEPLPPPSMATASVGGGLVRFQITPGSVELCLVGTTDPEAGGALLSRLEGSEKWNERTLAKLEYQLLRALCARATEEKDMPSAVRGCVSTKQLARDLPFQSKYANEENVRQVVRRLRQELGELGVESALAVAPGRGYYIACPVSVASSDRR
ncbi:MAG: FHA domain-containing protein [Deltaproteobacteria bacterium]|nr:FHA domain-containing protein [Deltaproteobacteria bacterium]